MINQLQNPTAAERLDHPLSFQPYPESKKRKYPYYRIHIGNFDVFYVVIDEEVRRFIYNKRDLDMIL